MVFERNEQGDEEPKGGRKAHLCKAVEESGWKLSRGLM